MGAFCNNHNRISLTPTPVTHLKKTTKNDLKTGCVDAKKKPPLNKMWCFIHFQSCTSYWNTSFFQKIMTSRFCNQYHQIATPGLEKQNHMSHYKSREVFCPCRPESALRPRHTKKGCGAESQPTVGLYTANKLYSRYTKLYWECQPCGKKNTNTHTQTMGRGSCE